MDPKRITVFRAWVAFCLTVFAVLLSVGRDGVAAAQLPKPLQDALTGDSSGQEAAEPPEEEEVPVEESIAKLEEKAAVAQEQYDNARAASEAGAAVQFGVPPEEVEKQVWLLREVLRATKGHVAEYRKLAEIRQARQDLDAEVAGWQGFTEPPPYSIDMLDELREAVNTRELEAESLETEKNLAVENLARVRKSMAVADQDLKAATDRFDNAAGDVDAVRQGWLRDLAQLNLQVVRATESKVETQITMLEEELDYHNVALEFARRKFAVAAANAPFTKNQLEEKLAAIAEAQQSLQAELKKCVEADDKAQEVLRVAREALRAAREAKVENEEEAQANAEETARLQAVADARKIQADTTTLSVEAVQLLMLTYSVDEEIWKERFEIQQTVSSERLYAVADRIKIHLDAAEQWRVYFDSSLRLSLTLVSNQRQRLATWQPDGGDKTLAQDILAAYEEREAISRRGLERIAAVDQLLRHFEEEVNERRLRVPWSERVKNIASTLYSYVTKVWDYELMSVGGEGITISKVIKALFILVLGVMLARRAARRVHGFVQTRFNAELSVAAAVEKGVYYTMLICVVLFALNTVQIPLTIFAFFGGAIAIGVGFGAQNLMNNFISGLIILLERPIKVGDVVDIEGVRGQIITIGARCSQVKRFDGIDMLVPNSTFLEKNVTNLTLSDRDLRFSVSVGVAYGSPVREVAKLIARAVNEHGRVLKDPEPMIIFEDFGDSALVFTAYFWLRLTTSMDYRIVQSDLRFQIEKLMREAGITIAFPQRDIHLDSASPIRIELVREDNSREDEG